MACAAHWGELWKRALCILVTPLKTAMPGVWLREGPCPVAVSFPEAGLSLVLEAEGKELCVQCGVCGMTKLFISQNS